MGNVGKGKKDFEDLNDLSRKIMQKKKLEERPPKTACCKDLTCVCASPMGAPPLLTSEHKLQRFFFGSSGWLSDMGN